MVLATRSAAWGERHPLSELRSCPALPKFGLVHAVIIYATSRRSAESNTHRAASPQMYPHPWRSRRSRTWSTVYTQETSHSLFLKILNVKGGWGKSGLIKLRLQLRSGVPVLLIENKHLVLALELLRLGISESNH